MEIFPVGREEGMENTQKFGLNKVMPWLGFKFLDCIDWIDQSGYEFDHHIA